MGSPEFRNMYVNPRMHMCPSIYMYIYIYIYIYIHKFKTTLESEGLRSSKRNETNPDRKCQAQGIISIYRWHLSEIFVEIYVFSFKKMHLKL